MSQHTLSAAYRQWSLSGVAEAIPQMPGSLSHHAFVVRPKFQVSSKASQVLARLVQFQGSFLYGCLPLRTLESATAGAAIQVPRDVVGVVFLITGLHQIRRSVRTFSDFSLHTRTDGLLLIILKIACEHSLTLLVDILVLGYVFSSEFKLLLEG